MNDPFQTFDDFMDWYDRHRKIIAALLIMLVVALIAHCTVAWAQEQKTVQQHVMIVCPNGHNYMLNAPARIVMAHIAYVGQIIDATTLREMMLALYPNSADRVDDFIETCSPDKRA